ncbi:enoyl-CoA hydratase, partial [Flavobacterium sp. IR1]
MKKVNIVHENEVTWIILNREELRNAIDEEVMDELL